MSAIKLLLRPPGLSWRAARLPVQTWLLALAQGLNLTSAVIAVTVAAAAGTQLAGSASLATLPYAAQFASVLVLTYPVSLLMGRFGRRPLFAAGAILLVAAGGVGFLAMQERSFLLLTCAHVLLGGYVAGANFYRFAAVDGLPDLLKPRAMSAVLCGGLLAAILGPALATQLRIIDGYAAYAWVYGALALLGVLSLVLVGAWRPLATHSVQQLSTRADETHRPDKAPAAIWVAMCCGGVGYFVMNLLMVEASLALANLCSFEDSSRAIQLHVLAMFAPSFFVAGLVRKLGIRSTLMAGFALLASAAMSAAFVAPTFLGIGIHLAVLGLGWNLTYSGGGILLSLAVQERARARWQGLNDLFIAACASAGAFAAAPLFVRLGWQGSNAVALPLCAACIALCAFTLRERTRAE